jgi:hypothetical protein
MGKTKGDQLKRPLSAYILYSTDKRPGIQESNPDLSLTDISKRLGAGWKALSAAERKPYEDKAAKLRDEYFFAKNSSGSSKAKKGAKSKGKKAASSSDESDD